MSLQTEGLAHADGLQSAEDAGTARKLLRQSSHCYEFSTVVVMHTS